MQDILISGLKKAVAELHQNEDKAVHIQDVVRRLAQASDNNPLDSVIRNMDDIFRKRASKNPHHIVTSEEFEAVRQDLWGLNPRSAIKELFPDLVYSRTSQTREPEQRMFADESAREVLQIKTDAQTVNEARDLVVEKLHASGIGYVQTKFIKGLYASYDDTGLPTDGVLLFQADVVTKSGESSLSVPVILAENKLSPPDSFGFNTMKYPLTKKGISDFAMGLSGIRADTDIDPSYAFGDNEVRFIPTVDNTVENMLAEAKLSVFNAFRDSGINNCQIRLGSFASNENETSGTLIFNVTLPFVSNPINVPIDVEGSVTFPPFKFTSASGDEFELNQEGVKRFISAGHISDATGLLHRVSGEGSPRDIPRTNTSEDFRGIISKKLSEDLTKFGAINPQVMYITTVENKDASTSAFIGNFGSSRGKCQVAIPMRIEGRTVKTPKHFFGEDEKPYEFSPKGMLGYLSAKAEYTATLPHASFYGEHNKETLNSDDIDLNSRVISRQNGFESRGRILEPEDNRAAKLLSNLRAAIASEMTRIGAVNPQINFDKAENENDKTTLHFAASFNTNFGIKRAMIPVSIIANNVIRPESFVGEDNSIYSMNVDGYREYLSTTESSQSELPARLNLLSYDRVRGFLKEAFAAQDNKQITAAMATISDRFGAETAMNCFSDMMLEAHNSQQNFTNKCGGCPFYRSRSHPQSHTAEDTCLKFNVKVAKVVIAEHNSQCSLVKKASSEEPFDGSIMQSNIKLT